MHIYFAHPCFNESQETFKREFLGRLRVALGQTDYGKAIGIVDPFDDTPNIEGNRETKLKLSRTVKETCLRMLEDCDIIVALVDDGDTGVAFEAGYAHAINIPIILVSKANCDEANAMLIGAARERIDNILQEEQIGKLARMFEWYYISKERDGHEPGKN
ncbi:MAG TPA: nucleoside 2-deoxyribosyltransferase [Syntrophorhabdaceae bacterium]|nr:nucleoside 2-deoxyribosyltransferase [Syntrophorhabdaceae bacterium]HOD75616.1 nucleoside 2-deoxyribosyltransferase [Syntrophorhabdaceae bacterium]